MKKIIIGLMALSSITWSTKAATNVGLELVLLADLSGSVSTTEFNLQKTGYVNAFQDAAVQAAIASTAGGIAVTLVYWSGAGQQSQVVAWTHITNAAQSNAFAAAIAGTTQIFQGQTAPGSALNFATPLFSTNLFDSNRQVIDVSGDGAENDGADTSTARDAALAAGVDTINGLPILGESGLLAWYQNNIQGGTNSFTTAAANFDTFEAAIKTKLTTEITNAPEGGTTIAMLGLALAGLAAFGRKFAV